MVSLNELAALGQILLIDISLAGDNAIAVGLAAAGLNQSDRKRAVVAGIIGATVLRIILAVFAVKLLNITGLLAAGGLLLLWVAYKMFAELRHARRVKLAREQKTQTDDASAIAVPAKKLSAAIIQIMVADVSMSLDNVLAVAGIAREHLWVLATGLALSVVLMGVAANYVAKLTGRHPWVAYIGVATILYTAAHMIWDGAQDLMEATG